MKRGAGIILSVVGLLIIAAGVAMPFTSDAETWWDPWSWVRRLLSSAASLPGWAGQQFARLEVVNAQCLKRMVEASSSGCAFGFTRLALMGREITLCSHRPPASQVLSPRE
jgi:hypothetical protein